MLVYCQNECVCVILTIIYLGCRTNPLCRTKRTIILTKTVSVFVLIITMVLALNVNYMTTKGVHFSKSMVCNKAKRFRWYFESNSAYVMLTELVVRTC